MEITKKNLNRFLFFKLPSAWWCGVRVREITASFCEVTVTHKWINQNPFKSMYFAVQAMAAELSTGALVMKGLKESGAKISMLVAQNKASFSKKATGKITFSCKEDKKISEAIKATIATGEGETFWLESQGVNSEGVVVSDFKFEWTIRLKK
ncbi:DUF4442 domain-containing protein [Aquimarina agarivorans]|uniref:DUF4442 domain-containing protein n=1 Tax=Aquimarina agarivorans TaxID=980584 RepID=UPI000248EB85|nr:DUF4442 domain-containing protein [Aquimarina agarivorans]